MRVVGKWALNVLFGNQRWGIWIGLALGWAIKEIVKWA